MKRMGSRDFEPLNDNVGDEGSVGQGITGDVPEAKDVNGLERAMQLAAEVALNGDGSMGHMVHGEMPDDRLYSRHTESIDPTRSSAPVGRYQPRSRRGSMQQDWYQYGASHGYRYDTGSVSGVRISIGNHAYEELGPPAIIKDTDGQEYLVQPVRESLDIYRDSAAVAQTPPSSHRDVDVYHLSNLYAEGEAAPAVQDEHDDLFTPFGLVDEDHGMDPTKKRHSQDRGKTVAQMLQQYEQGTINSNFGASEDELMEALRKASISTGGSIGRPDVLQGGSPNIPRGSLNGNVDVGQLYLQGLMSKPPSMSCPVDPEFRMSLLRNRTSQEFSGTLRKTSNDLLDQYCISDAGRLSTSSARMSGGIYDPRQGYSLDQNGISDSRTGTSIYSASEEGDAWEIDINEIQFGPRIGIGAYGA